MKLVGPIRVAKWKGIDAEYLDVFTAGAEDTIVKKSVITRQMILSIMSTFTTRCWRALTRGDIVVEHHISPSESL